MSEALALGANMYRVRWVKLRRLWVSLRTITTHRLFFGFAPQTYRTAEHFSKTSNLSPDCLGMPTPADSG